ncbi:MAG: peptidoglycan DD-metalloendopeptidase family protein [Deltaproteobacteria bacterium]|nr:peptidoglycan DD-metalloendopeptidase family protein [Deltaproteobacteria bacterium]
MLSVSKTIFKVFLTAAMVLILFSDAAIGADPNAIDDADPAPFDPVETEATIEALRGKSSRIDRRIDAEQKDVQLFTKKEVDLLNSLDKTERRLNQTRKAVAKTRSDLTKLGKKIEKNQAAIHALKAEIRTLERYAAKRLVALYKLGQLGKMPVLASAESIYDMLNRQRGLERILSADEIVWRQLGEKKALLLSYKHELAEQRQNRVTRTERLNRQMTIMTQQQAKRASLLSQIQKKKALALAAVHALKEASRQLDRQIEALNWEVHPTGVSDRLDPAAFDQLKGLLKAPANGKIIFKFGHFTDQRLNYESFRNGIEIKADRGEPIRAIYSGTTLYADWFKGYGNMIIIDHGHSYCSVYANAEDLFKEKGDRVDLGEVIGTVGDSGSLIGPKLHFEIRFYGKPIDPIAWIASE